MLLCSLVAFLHSNQGTTMTLELGYEDLKHEHKDCNPSQTRFHMFTDKAQKAIRIVGKAMFFNGDKSNYNAIYPQQSNKVVRTPTKGR